MVQFDPQMVAQMLMQPIQRASENLGGGPFGIGADAGGSYFVDPEVAARTGYGTAVTGTSFFPGAGIVDAYGGAVDVKGQPLPSFSENIREGQFTDAALQALGVAGDVAMVAAPLTLGTSAVLGTALKAPRAAQKIARGVDEIDETRRNVLLGMAATPIALETSRLLKTMPNTTAVKKVAKLTKGDGILSLAKSLDKGIIPDKKVMEAVMHNVENRLDNLKDDMVYGYDETAGADYDNLDEVYSRLQALEKTDNYPAKIENLKKEQNDLLEAAVENFIVDIRESDDTLDLFDIDIMDYTKSEKKKSKPKK